MMEIEINATELRVGDIFQGRRIVGVHVGKTMTDVNYETGSPVMGYGACFYNNTQVLVKREVERIEI